PMSSGLCPIRGSAARPSAAGRCGGGRGRVPGLVVTGSPSAVTAWAGGPDDFHSRRPMPRGRPMSSGLCPIRGSAARPSAAGRCGGGRGRVPGLVVTGSPSAVTV
ncbi:hypothetical protein ACPF8X_21535, partial [Streptomyces sp. G35A]